MSFDQTSFYVNKLKIHSLNLNSYVYNTISLPLELISREQ